MKKDNSINSKFNQTEYAKQYNKEKYIRCDIRIKKEISDIITEYSKSLDISKAALIQKCVLYCYENYIDVSGVKLSTLDKKD